MASQLLALPRELRDMIWEFVVGSNEIVVGRKKLVPRSKRLQNPESRKKTESHYRYRQTNIGILLVNRQVYREARPIFYLETTFYIQQRYYSVFHFAFDVRMSRIRFMTHMAKDAAKSWKDFRAHEKRRYCDLVGLVAQSIAGGMGDLMAELGILLEVAMVDENAEVVWVLCEPDSIRVASEAVEKALKASE